MKFVDLYAQSPDPAAQRDYEALLADLETSFQALSQRLHDGVRTDMDIEIEVLRERLAREGCARPPAPRSRIAAANSPLPSCCRPKSAPARQCRVSP